MTQPQYSQWLIEACSRLEHPFARDSQEFISFFYELANAIPQNHIWRQSSPERLNEQQKQASPFGPSAVNRVIWTDVSEDLDAWRHAFLYRSKETIEALVATLNYKQIGPAGNLARSLLEIAVVVLTEANKLKKTFETLPTPTADHVLIPSEEIEKWLLRLMWGTRKAGNPEHLTQKNILSYIEWLNKNPKLKELRPVYEELCEITHPNSAGYKRFMSALAHEEGLSVSVNLNCNLPIEESIGGRALLTNILWALGWSAVCLRNSYHMIENCLHTIDSQFHTGKTITYTNRTTRNATCPCGSGKKFKRCHGRP